MLEWPATGWDRWSEPGRRLDEPVSEEYGRTQVCQSAPKGAAARHLDRLSIGMRSSPPYADVGESTAAATAALGNARVTLEILAGKWVVPIVTVLMAGPRRHGDLHDAIGSDLSQKVLTETLRRMERAGLLSREVRAEVPPAVSYALTDLGRSLIEPIRHLAQWAAIHSQRLPK